MSAMPNSLTLRVVVFSSGWAIIALVVIATVISTLYRQASERNFERLLEAHLFNLIGAVGLDPSGNPVGDPDFGDIRYTELNSGWYWSVETIGADPSRALRSPSMTGPVQAPTVGDVPFDARFRRTYVAPAPGGAQVRVVEGEYLLGANDRIVRFRLMGNESAFQADLASFSRLLWTYLGLFGAGMIAINVGAILLGLRPLDTVRRALAGIREGRTGRLPDDLPREIAPLGREMNALIDNNRRIVERSRIQVGNLAHSLKTPLAVLLNEAEALGGKHGALISAQAASMRTQIDHYLQRARIAAQRDSVVFRCDAAPVLDRLARAMGKLHPDKAIDLDLGSGPAVFAGEEQDLEEIAGNLLENAAKWARSRALVTLRADSGDALSVRIDDDGPGIPDDRIAEAVQRGARLDETRPGTGLGLAIVSELVREYSGQLRFERSDMGGLRVHVDLPAAP